MVAIPARDVVDSAADRPDEIVDRRPRPIDDRDRAHPPDEAADAVLLGLGRRFGSQLEPEVVLQARRRGQRVLGPARLAGDRHVVGRALPIAEHDVQRAAIALAVMPIAPYRLVLFAASQSLR